jgi:hypothetical protein
MTPRKPLLIAGRKALRQGTLAAACLVALVTTVPANAVATGPRFLGRAAAVDWAHTLANSAQPVQYDEAFGIHELGPAIGVGAHNRAVAVSVGCSPARPCRSIALSFQIVTMAGPEPRLNASNTSHAENRHCPGCQTYAAAYQFVVVTPRPVLDGRIRERLADVHRQLIALERSNSPIPVIASRAESLAAEVKSVLGDAAAAQRGARPTVTLHRDVG